MRKRGRKKRNGRKKTVKPSASGKLEVLRPGLVALAVFVLGLVAWFVLRNPGPRSGFPEQLTRGSARGFNVLLITLDTTRADHLGCYGYAGARTPVLDGLAAEGIRFDDAVTTTPSTLPSHATILTGLFPPNHGVRNNGQYRLADEQTTLAEVVRNEGYETAAFTSAFVLDSRFGLDQGFDVYDDNIGEADSMVFSEHANQRSAGAVTGAAVEWLGRRDDRRPFFMWVHYYDPHAPYRPPPPFDAEFRDRPYDGEIAYMDSQIGRLRQALTTRGLWDKTLTVVVSDHGEGLGDHGEATHGRLIYESVMRAPLIICCPGVFRDPHVVDDVVVSIADIFPTIVELLDIENPPSVDGISLLGAAHAGRMVYLDSMAPYLENGWSPLLGLRRHDDKYILAPRPEYYHLSDDPGELNNLYQKVSGAALAARNELVAELSSRAEQWPSLADVVAAAGQPDPETIRRLQSLGYVGTLSVEGTERELPDPKDMMVVLRNLDRAETLMSAGRHVQALEIVKKTAVLSACDHDVHHMTGKIYLRMGREEEAEEAFLRANGCQATVDTYLLLGQIRIKHGRYDEATEALDRASELDPLHGGVHVARGDLLALHRRPREAIAAYERAAEVDPYRVGGVARKRIERIRQAFPAVTAP